MITKLVETENGYIVNDITFVPKTSVGYMMDEIVNYISGGVS